MLSGGIKITSELGEGSHFSVLSQLQFESSGHSLHGLDLGGGSHSRHGQTDVDGRADTFVEQFGFQEDLPIGNRNDVGGDIRGHVSGLGFNNGKSG